MKAKEVIIVDGKDVTDKVSYYRFDALKLIWNIKYKGNNTFYHYKKNRVRIVQNSDKVLDYMKEVSSFSSSELLNQNGESILASRVKKIDSVDLDTALANYMKMSLDTIKGDSTDLLIFPFGCNSSQYKAVENAINRKISVIEGPPGTGKTQTILNIIANIIVRNMNCQVVSNNNAAIENIDEKLKKYDLDFISALLGKKENKDFFVDNQVLTLPDLDEYKAVDVEEVTNNLRAKRNLVREIYNIRNEIASLQQRKNEITLEYKYFQAYVKNENVKLIDVKFSNFNKLKKLFSELISMKKINFFHICKFVFSYKVGDFDFYKNDIDIMLNSLKQAIYLNDLESIDYEINCKQEYVEKNKKDEQNFINLSMLYFKNFLACKYSRERRAYSANEIWKDSRSFLKDYPVILSTTYSSKNSINNNLKFDYIIMDEASQIDLVTGTLALSSSKYAVIIGDEKQLPNVVTDPVMIKDNKVFRKYDIDKGYCYSLNSFLSSVKNVVLDISVTLLKEHYRCHPKIINFCNQKFYNDELVIMTNDNGEEDVVKVIKTSMGNHARGLSNQRQIDVIKELIGNLKIDDLGIIAPYNDQVDLIKENIPNADVSTVHKFQGRERDTIIITTVEDKISDFVADPNLLNVAVSRAKKQLIFIVTGNEIRNKNIKDFIDYVYYNNMEITESKISSVFDILYKQNELEKINFFKKNNRVLKFDSENLIYYLLKRVVDDYENLDFIFYQPLKELIKDKSLLTEDEIRYVNHRNTHVDFSIFDKISKKTILVIEVDGYKYHKKGTKQSERDLLKNSILDKYSLPYLRLLTNGSEEEKRIRNKLDDILK